MSIHLRRLPTTRTSSPDLERTLATFRDAFGFEGIDAAISGYDPALVEPNWRSTLLAALAPDCGEVWVAGLQDGDIDAAIILFGPGRWAMKHESERKMREEMYECRVSEEGKAFIQEFVKKQKLLQQRCFGDNFDERKRASCYINVVGTRKDKQGQGLGSALIRKVFEMADADGAETIISANTIENVRFYERLGFVSGGEPESVSFRGGECGLWCLTRQPSVKSE